MTTAQARKYAATAVDMIDDELMKLGASVQVVKV
jgi:chemotaxis receptor (MCP) glutamine deamidase CheD